MGMIRRNIEYKAPSVMVRLYKNLVRPHLEYGMVAWAQHYVKDKEKLERIQRRFTKMIEGFGSLDHVERARRLGLMSLEERRNRADLIELFRMIKGFSAVTMEEFFERDMAGKTRGHSYKLRKTRFATETRRHFFSQRVIDAWNELREEDVAVNSIDAFKLRLLERRRTRMDLLKD